MTLTPEFISYCADAIIGFWILAGLVVLCVSPLRRNASPRLGRGQPVNPMDRLTVHWVVAWAVFIACPLAGLAVARRIRRLRREDREWAAGVARRMRRRGAPPFLTDEEEAAFARIVAHYNDVPLDEILDSEGEDL